MWRWTVSPEDAPDEPTYIELTFLNGDIVAIDGIQKDPFRNFINVELDWW